MTTEWRVVSKAPVASVRVEQIIETETDVIEEAVDLWHSGRGYVVCSQEIDETTVKPDMSAAELESLDRSRAFIPIRKTS